MTPARSITVSTPAKINLGLEILGRRTDGYHEIRTVLAAVDLADSIRITHDQASDEVRISGVPDVQPQDNIIGRAIDLFAEATGIRTGLRIDVEKQIPSPGGMGGASSNAAGTLLALDALFETSLKVESLRSMGARLGSDVPFFLGSACALASGTGTELEPLPSLDAAAVLVTPTVGIASKTATLYRALRPVDFTDGSSVSEVARAIERGALPAEKLLVNAFTRPLYELIPSLEKVSGVMSDTGASHVALTGAGPGHYALLDSIEDARTLADDIRRRVDPDVRVTAASFLTGDAIPLPLER